MGRHSLAEKDPETALYLLERGYVGVRLRTPRADEVADLRKRVGPGRKPARETKAECLPWAEAMELAAFLAGLKVLQGRERMVRAAAGSTRVGLSVEQVVELARLVERGVALAERTAK